MRRLRSLHGDLTVELRRGHASSAHGDGTDDWTVDLVDTGHDTETGGRIKRLAPHIGDGTFMLTWGDGVSDVDLDALLAFHRSHGKLATVTAVRPPARFGHLEIDGDAIERVLREAADRRGLDQRRLLRARAGGLRLHRRRRDRSASASRSSGSPRDGQLMAYRHDGFWQCMDTLRDKAARGALGKRPRRPGRCWS